MGRLGNNEIVNILSTKGYEAVDLNGYQNKSSKITAQCPKGHIVNICLSDFEKVAFKCPKCIGMQFEVNANTNTVPAKNGYRIVAFDQSSNVIGVSIYDDGKLVYYNWYRLTGELEERLSKWYMFLTDTVVNEWKPDYIMFEDIQYQKDAGVVTFKILAMVLGIGIMAAEKHNIEHSEVLNKTWQSDFQISGSNRIAQKKNVIERVKEYFDIDVTDDVGDAILIGRYAANRLYKHWNTEGF